MSDAAPEIAWLHRDWEVTNDQDKKVATFDRWEEDDISYTRTDLHLAALAERDARIAALVAGLRQYRDELCEGFCGELEANPDYCDELPLDWQSDCNGCLARALLNGGKP